MPIQTRALTGSGPAQGAGGGAVVPNPSSPGQVLMSRDGDSWSALQPVVSAADGWLSNNDEELLVEGL